MADKVSLKRKVILVTGTSRSIGAFIARHYLDKGHYVVGCARGESAIKEANYHHYCLDVADESKVLRMFAEIEEKFRCLDVLVNNAGTYFSVPAVLTSMTQLEEIFRTNVFGTYLFCREAYKVMLEGKSGSIVNFSTIAVPLASRGTCAYSSSKAAVEQLSRVLAAEYMAAGINVNTLGLSIVEGSGMAGQMGEGVCSQTLAQTASRNKISFQEIAQAIDLFIAPENRRITGQIRYLGL